MNEILAKIFQFLADFFKSIAQEPKSEESLYELIKKNSPGIGPKMLKMSSEWFFHESVTNLDYLILVDFDYRESSPRLWLVDRKTGESEAFKVAHGSKSDPNKDGFATEFSNTLGSNKSSLGAMVTGDQYGNKDGGWSKFPHALKLKGLDHSLNSNVFERAIVFHSSNYVDDVKGKLIGDSLGCLAVSEATAEAIIDLIDGGALVFSYHKSLDDLVKPSEHFKSFDLTQGINLIKEFEGLRLKAYLDPVGIPTIGYGTIQYPRGDKVKMGDEITTEQANSYLIHHIETDVTPHLDRLVTTTLNQNQYNALVSFIYNLGVGNFGKSTLLKRLNESKFQDAAQELLRWVYAKGKVLNGLVRRRQAEKALFEK